MKYKIKRIIHNFASWLLILTHEKTATEIAILHELDDQCCCEYCWEKEQKSNYKWLCENHAKDNI